MNEVSTIFNTNNFEDQEQRLVVLDEKIARAALLYAASFYCREKCTKEAAVERGIVKAELMLRDL